MDDDAPEPMTRYSMRQIIAAACAASGLTREEITGEARSMKEVIWRQASMYVGRKNGKSTTQIGNALNRDHTTVIHALYRLSRYRQMQVEKAAAEIEDLLRNPRAVEIPDKPLPVAKPRETPKPDPVAKRMDDYDRIRHWYGDGNYRPFAYLRKDAA